jgi:hypothetical protein
VDFLEYSSESPPQNCLLAFSQRSVVLRSFGSQRERSCLLSRRGSDSILTATPKGVGMTK